MNRVLASEPWARERLAAHAGRTFALRTGPIAGGFRIDPGGLLEPLRGAASATTADLTLTLSPLDLAPFLADPRRWNELVVEQGDVQLGGTLKDIAATLPWFVEKLFARALGPIVGQRVADAGRRMLGMPEYVASRMAANVGSYARDEAQLLAHPAEMREFTAQAEALAPRIDALGARIAAIEAQLGATGNPGTGHAG
ncbi:MAG: ubiquinone biosynthesis accessory factor UbiJ [Casimicrobiaceae bacterium]